MANSELSGDSPTPARRASRRTFLKACGVLFVGASAGGLLAACDTTESPAAGGVLPGAATPVPGTPAPANTAPAGATTAPGATGTALPSAAAATPTATASGDPRDSATAFLTAWQEKRYEDMYGMLNQASRQAITKDAFVSRYGNIAAEATLVSLSAVIGNAPPTPGDGQPFVRTFPFNVTYHTGRVGDFTIQNRIALWPDNGQWLVDWKPSLIFPQLTGTNLVHMNADQPIRGEIVDRFNKPLAKRDIAYAVFVVKGKIQDENAVLDILSQTLKIDRAKIKPMYDPAQPDWRTDIGQLPATTPQEVIDKLTAVHGIGVDNVNTRTYPNGTVGANVVGYLNKVNADDLKTLAAQGYTEDDLIGRTGVEAGSEPQLAGVKGGDLFIMTTDGQKVVDIAQKASTPSATIHTSLDPGIQKIAEDALGKRPGSVVILDPYNGEVLALATFPTYDPNLFIGGISTGQYNALLNDPQQPFLNRPLNATYPTGSIFKVITASAALEHGGLTMDSTFVCAGHWTALGANYARDCWLKTGHGRISMFQAIVQSCDIFFYETGKKLDSIDPMILPNMARAYGLGAATGVTGIYENAGVVPDPAWKQKAIGQGWVTGDAVSLAIGQGYLLATPLQMALTYSAIGTGAGVPLPRLAVGTEVNSSLTPIDPKTKALPVSGANLAQIRQALYGATSQGAGTSTAVFRGAKVKVAGKTGTAENTKPTPHSWYASFAPVDNPRYTIIAMAENAGEGTDVAAPIVRKIIDQLPFN